MHTPPAPPRDPALELAAVEPDALPDVAAREIAHIARRDTAARRLARRDRRARRQNRTRKWHLDYQQGRP